MSNMPSIPLSPLEQRAFQEALLAFLAAHAARYTSGDSTSVPAETAESLFSSVCFCLRLSPEDAARQRFLLRVGIDPAFREGLGEVEQRRDAGKRLWEAVCCRLPPVENVFLTDTLREIGQFWKRYEPRYFACEIPCSIDYPTAIPVSEKLLGIDYVNCYLQNLAIEHDFLRCLPPEILTKFERRTNPNYRMLPLNLFEPAAINALGRGLLGLSPDPLFLSSAECIRIHARFSACSREALGAALQASADMLSATPHGSAGRRAYLRAVAARLLPRLSAAWKHGCPGGVFLTA